MPLQITRDGTTYTARDDGAVLWVIELPIDRQGSTFHAELHWPAAKVVAIGGGRVVHFVDEASGAIVKTLDRATGREVSRRDRNQG